MVFLCLGYVVGTYVTKGVKEFLDPRPPTATPFNQQRPVHHELRRGESSGEELEEVAPVSQTCCCHRHNNWPFTQVWRNAPISTFLPCVQGGQGTQQVHQSEAVMLLRLPWMPQPPQTPNGGGLPLLEQLRAHITYMIGNRYVIGGVTLLGIAVIIPFAGSFAPLVGSTTVYRIGSVSPKVPDVFSSIYSVAYGWIVAAAPKVLKGFSSACSGARRRIVAVGPELIGAASVTLSVAKSGIAVALSLIQFVGLCINQTLVLVIGAALLMVSFIMYSLVFISPDVFNFLVLCGLFYMRRPAGYRVGIMVQTLRHPEDPNIIFRRNVFFLYYNEQAPRFNQQRNSFWV